MSRMIALLCCLIPAVAVADVELDASNFIWRGDESAWLPVGGPSGQMFAQTFKAEHSAPLVQVELVIGCFETGAGSLTVEVQDVGLDGLPNGTVLTDAEVDSADLLSSEPQIQAFPMSGLSLVTGAAYAIVLRGEDTVDCVMPEGAWLLGVFDYEGGAAYSAEPPGPPPWSPVDFQSGDDLAFWVYVNVPSPFHCEVADYSGLPQTWEIGDVPACGCVSDTVLLHNRCWFAFPEWVLWRELPIPTLYPEGRAEWWLVPMDSGMPALNVLETDGQGGNFSNPVFFDAGVQPGKPHKLKVDYAGQPTATRVNVEFQLDGQDAHVSFETVIEEQPPQN